MSERWFVYIITNYTNAVLYIGITNNIKRRIYEHRQGLLKGSFSHKYHLYKLIWLEEFNTPSEAIEAEKKIKGWRREKKIKLICAKNPRFKDLFTLR